MPENASLAALLLFGLVIGARHALEADHMAAVATLVTDRRSVWGSTVVGGLWGLGHTTSLLIAGVAVIALHVRIPERVSQALEFCVGLMLIGLAVNALARLRRGEQLHVHTHTHGEVTHQHPHWHTHSHDDTPHSHDPRVEPPSAPSPAHHPLPAMLRPVLVGMVHGMAGSAALMLVLLTTIPSTGGRFLYLGSFGAGSIGGMMLTSGLIGLPLALTAARFERWNRGLQGVAALMSLGIGLEMVYQIGWVDGLLIR